MLSAQQYPLSKIFSDDFKFSIPDYQRPYSWGVEQADELLDDLFDYMTANPGEVGEMPEYFLGSIVLIKSETKPDSEVIDGQQRLTTLSILLSVIRHLVSADNVKGALSKFILEEANPLTGTSASYRLTLRRRDDEFFRKHIQDAGGIDELATEDLDLPDAQQNITKNAKRFEERLKELDSDALSRFAGFLSQKCVLVAVSTPDFDSAFRIFSVLNSRGLDLTATDLLKADIIGKISDDARDSYTTKWEDTEEKLGRDNFGDLFSHIRMIYRKSKPKGTLRKEFNESVTFASPESFIDDMLQPYARAFDAIAKANYLTSGNAQEINTPIKWLNRIQFKDWMPPAIEYLKRHWAKGSAESIAQFFRDLERLTYSMLIRRAGINDRIDRFSRLTKEIQDGNDLSATDSALQLSMKEMSETIMAIEGPLYETHSPRSLGVLLCRLDSLLADAGAEYEVNTISVEHVLPQNPGKDSRWCEWIERESDRKSWVDRLGNLTLLDRKRNSSASNYDLEKKKNSYFFSKGKSSPFVMTAQFATISKWDVEALKVRQEQLVGKLEDHLRLEDGRFYKATAANKSNIPDASFTFITSGSKIKAEAQVLNGEFTVKKDSIAQHFTPGGQYSYQALKGDLINSGAIVDAGDHLVFTRDVVFSSPSAASSVLLGRNDNGTASWKEVATGKPLKEWLASAVVLP